MESLSAALRCFTNLKLTPLITQSSFGGSCLRWAWFIQFIRTISAWNPFIDNLIRMLKIKQKLDKFNNFLVLFKFFLDPGKLRFLNSLCDILAYATNRKVGSKKGGPLC